MDTRVLKKCMTSTKSGQLRDVLNTLNRNAAFLKSEEAVKIVICICNACVDNSARTQFMPNDVLELMMKCLKTIEDLNSTLMNSFLASIFHIIKYFIDVNEYICIIDLHPGIIRILKGGLKEEKLIKLANNIHKIIYNCILTIFTYVSSEDLSKLCLFSIEILNGSKKLCDLLKEELFEYFKGFSYLQLELKDQRSIYTKVIKLIVTEITSEELLLNYFDANINLVNSILQNHLKENKVLEIKELICNTTKTFESVVNVSDDMKNIFIIMESVIPLISPEDKYSENIKSTLSRINENFQQIYNKKMFLQSVIQFSKFLHLILYYMMQNLKTFTKKFWSDFDVECLVILNTFSINVALSLSSIQSKCKDCDDCLLTYDFVSSASISIIPIYMLKYCLSNDNKSEINIICKEMNRSLQLACTLVQKLQEFKCSNWKTIWIEVGTLMYNFGVTLYRIKHANAIFYISYFIKKLILIEGVNNTILKETILNSALLNLVESYMRQKDSLKAMVFCAFNIYLHPNNQESPFWQWIRIKSEEKEDVTLQNTNLVSIFDRKEIILSHLHPSFSIDEAVKKNLLLFELKQYKKIWPSKVSFASAFKELTSCTDTVTIAEALVAIWGDGENTIPVDLHDTILDIAQKFETEILVNDNTTENNFLMAFLHLIKYFVICRKTQQKNCVDMKATHDTVDIEAAIDKNDQCDVVSSYKSLTLEVHLGITEYLKKSLDIFKSQVNEKNKNELCKHNIYSAINNIANEYLLHCHTFEYLKAWLLAYKIAKILNNKLCVIESVAYLLEKSDPNSQFIKDALVEVEELIKQVCVDKAYEDGENSIRKWIVLCNFYITRGLICLNCSNAKVALNLFKEAKLIYEVQTDSKQFELLQVKYEFFKWRLQLLPCSFKMEGHKNSLSKPHFLMESISQYYKNNGGSSTYILCLLFEVFCSVLHFNRWTRQPREVRCYGRELIHLAQELLIPFRTIRILSYLADADLLSKGLDNCRMKINGICDILGLSKGKTSTNYSVVEKKTTVMTEEVLSLTNTFQEMMLDFPTTKKQYYQSTSGSPDLYRDTFEIPDFIGHGKGCDCFCCLSLDYQEFGLISIAMQGNLCYFQNNLEGATEYYQRALYIYRRLLNKEKLFQNQIQEILNVRIFPHIEFKFKEVYCVILLNLGNCLAHSDKFMQISTELVKTLKKNHYFNIYLYNEALYQQFNYLRLKNDDTTKQNLKLSPMTENINAENNTTPESKCSTVNLVVPTYTPVSTTKKKIRKTIIFDLSDDDDKEAVATKPHSPPAGAFFPTTPAVSTSKIKVYQPMSIRTTRKKKTFQKLEFASEKKENIALKFEPPKAPQELRSKTKLLTEKLKTKSVVPNIVVTNASETESSNIASENKPRRTRGVRKNLMSELSIEDNNEKPTSASYDKSSNNDNNNKGAVKKRVGRPRKVL